jgi:hypothetical protein
VSSHPIFYFLVVYDQNARAVTRIDAFLAPDQADEALATYREVEAEYRDNPRVEVLLAASESEEMLMSTHGNYFLRDRPDERSPYLAGL